MSVFLDGYVYPTVREQHLAQAQNNATSIFGSSVRFCQSYNKLPVITGAESLPLPIKLAAIEDNQTILTDYDQIIPTQNHATSAANMTAILCVHVQSTLVSIDTYKTDGLVNTGETCSRYRQDILATLINAHNGHVVRGQKFLGVMPPACPNSAQFVHDETGDLPHLTLIMDWVMRNS